MLTLLRSLSRSWRSRWPLRFGILVCLSTVLCLALPAVLKPVPLPPVLAQPTPASRAMDQGRDAYAAGQYAAAVEFWQQAAQDFARQGAGANAASALSNQGLAHLQLGQYEAAQAAIAAARDWLQTLPRNDYSQRVLAQVLNTEGQLYMAQGDASRALQVLDQAIAAYGAVNDPVGQIRANLNRAHILRVQGNWREMRRSLQGIATDLEALPDDSPLKAAGLRQLALTLQQSGDQAQAERHLQDSLAVAERSGDAAEISATLLTLGNVAEGETALTYYRRAAASAPTPLGRVQAQVNALGVLWDQGQTRAANTLLPEILAQFPALPPSRATFLVRIHLVSQLLRPEVSTSADLPLPVAALTTLLTDTVEAARAIGDGQGQTYGLGYLGRLHELTRQWSAAQRYTEQALVVSQGIQADAAEYQWQWQLGRIFEVQGQTAAAILAYQQAIDRLQKLRSDLVATDREARFSFRESIEPVYRDFVDLLLKTDPEQTQQENLFQARTVIESLQVEELVNFFRADCVVTRPQQIDQVDTQAAVIYPIILSDRVEVIVGVPNQPLLRHPAPVSKAIVEETLDHLLTRIAFPGAGVPALADRSRSERARLVLTTGDTETTDYLTPAQQVYDWLIRPFETALQNSGVDTLAFVLDGKLRNVPMAVLHDGNQFLVEKYAIALTPGLQLLDPQPLVERQVQALVGGLSEARGDFSPLPFVQDEITAIQSQVPGQVLLNETFNTQTFATELTTTPFPVVHLATHGNFGASLEDTYIVTWDGRIDANQLSTLLQTSEISRDGTIELLILSACETAAGDDRAALGLAGIAVRSGARSTLATLWQVNDLGTSLLMGDLYRELATTPQTKAQILRQAQLNLLAQPDYQHPYFWAPFVLVGNWL